MSTTTTATQDTTESLVTDASMTIPDAGADYFQLGMYINSHLKASSDHEEKSKQQSRQATIHKWYAGAALRIVRDREGKDGSWVRWCKAHGLNISTCYEAIRLCNRSGSIENVKDLTITEARRKYRTDKKSYLPPGEQNPPQRIAAKVAPKKVYTETEHLRELREECEKLIDSVAVIEDSEWKHADPHAFIDHIDKAIERLRQARRAIRTAEKAKPSPVGTQAKPQASPTSKTSPKSSGDSLASVLDGKDTSSDGDESLTNSSKKRVKSKQ